MQQENLATTATFLIIAATVTAAATQHQTKTAKAEFLNNGKVVAELTLQVSDSPQERKKGLMNREKLPRNKGMLFIFPDEKQRTFWMKNTSIPLDIIFIDANGTIVDIDHAEPEPGTPENKLTRYRSDSPAKYVIEVYQGFSKRHSIEPGEEVVLEN